MVFVGDALGLWALLWRVDRTGEIAIVSLSFSLGLSAPKVQPMCGRVSLDLWDSFGLARLRRLIVSRASQTQLVARR